MTLAEEVKQFRENQGYSQRQLGRMVGISGTLIHLIEAGNNSKKFDLDRFYEVMDNPPVLDKSFIMINYDPAPKATTYKDRGCQFQERCLDCKLPGCYDEMDDDTREYWKGLFGFQDKTHTFIMSPHSRL